MFASATETGYRRGSVPETLLEKPRPVAPILSAALRGVDGIRRPYGTMGRHLAVQRGSGGPDRARDGAPSEFTGIREGVPCGGTGDADAGGAAKFGSPVTTGSGRARTDAAAFGRGRNEPACVSGRGLGRGPDASERSRARYRDDLPVIPAGCHQPFPREQQRLHSARRRQGDGDAQRVLHRVRLGPSHALGVAHQISQLRDPFGRVADYAVPRFTGKHRERLRGRTARLLCGHRGRQLQRPCKSLPAARVFPEDAELFRDGRRVRRGTGHRFGAPVEYPLLEPFLGG